MDIPPVPSQGPQAPAHIASLLASAKNPRYATDAPPKEAPIEFDVIGPPGHPTTFVAHPQDQMDYGRALWAAAQKGDHGVVAAYDPPMDVRIDAAAGAINTFSYGLLSQVCPGQTRHQTLIVAINDPGTVPMESFAKLWGMSLPDFEDFVAQAKTLRMDVLAQAAEAIAAIEAANIPSDIAAAKQRMVAGCTAAAQKFMGVAEGALGRSTMKTKISLSIPPMSGVA